MLIFFNIEIKKPALAGFLISGRGGGIRTRDPLHPMQVRYQAALHPDEPKIIPENFFSHTQKFDNRD